MIVKKCKTNYCWVTFRVRYEGAKSIHLVGEWSGWKKESMKKSKSGYFWITKRLKKGKYRFKYVVDDTNWINDEQADDYVPNPFGGTDGVLILR